MACLIGSANIANVEHAFPEGKDFFKLLSSNDLRLRTLQGAVENCLHFPGFPPRTVQKACRKRAGSMLIAG
jgi:hypothetical protein